MARPHCDTPFVFVLVLVLFCVQVKHNHTVSFWLCLFGGVSLLLCTKSSIACPGDDGIMEGQGGA
jgi:hypothetical protein